MQIRFPTHPHPVLSGASRGIWPHDNAAHYLLSPETAMNHCHGQHHPLYVLGRHLWGGVEEEEGKRWGSRRKGRGGGEGGGEEVGKRKEEEEEVEEGEEEVQDDLHDEMMVEWEPVQQLEEDT